MVDNKSLSFKILRSFMIRLSTADFDDPHEIAKYAATANMSLHEFHEQFQYLVVEDTSDPTRHTDIYINPDKTVSDKNEANNSKSN
jgi:hypothetical protein